MAKRQVKDEKVLKAEINIKIYEPINNDPETHRPQIIFTGNVLSMKALSGVEFALRKALRRHKIEESKRLQSELEPTEKENSDE